MYINVFFILEIRIGIMFLIIYFCLMYKVFELLIKLIYFYVYYDYYDYDLIYFKKFIYSCIIRIFS